MKIKFVLICIMITLFFFSSTIPVTAAKGKDKTANLYWKQLKKTKQIDNVRIYDNPDKSLAPGMVKSYMMDMSQIRLLLESAKVVEPVIIELRTIGLKLICTIGKFEPTLDTKDGNTIVTFDSIPKEAMIIISRNDELTNEAFTDSLQENRFLLNNPSYIFFKNAKKKLKARPKIKFLYVSH